MSKVVKLPQARQDLKEIWRYIAQDSPASADRLLDRIDDKCRLLAEYPNIGHNRQELAVGLQSFPVGRYTLFYRLIDDGIEVVRVLHSARDITQLF